MEEMSRFPGAALLLFVWQMDKVSPGAALLLSAWLRTLLDKTAATIAPALKLTSATTAVCERERDESTIITTRLVKY